MHELTSTDEFSDAIEKFYPAIEGLRLNLRLNPNGVWPTSHPKTEAWDPDRTLLSHLRSRSDVIITGGETARVENYGVSKWAPIMVLSNNPKTLSLPLFQSANQNSTAAILVTSNPVLAQKYKPTKFLGPKTNQDSAMLRAELQNILLAEGFKRPLLETGAALSRILLPMIKEICLTAPVSADSKSLLSGIGVENYRQLSELSFDSCKFSRWLLAG